MSIYDVTITGASGAAPADGFIDSKTISAHLAVNADAKPTTYAQSLAKSRANRRFRNLVHALQFYAPEMEIVSVTLGGSPSAITAPTNIVLRLSGNLEMVSIPDDNEGAEAGDILEGEEALIRVIGRVLNRSESRNMTVYDPTLGVSNGTTVEYARRGEVTNTETIGPVYATLTAAEAAVAVSEAP